MTTVQPVRVLVVVYVFLTVADRPLNSCRLPWWASCFVAPLSVPECLLGANADTPTMLSWWEVRHGNYAYHTQSGWSHSPLHFARPGESFRLVTACLPQHLPLRLSAAELTGSCEDKHGYAGFGCMHQFRTLLPMLTHSCSSTVRLRSQYRLPMHAKGVIWSPAIRQAHLIAASLILLRIAHSEYLGQATKLRRA